MRQARFIGRVECDGVLARRLEGDLKIKGAGFGGIGRKGEGPGILQHNGPVRGDPIVFRGEARLLLAADDLSEAGMDDLAAVMPLQPEITFIHTSMSYP